MKKIMAIVVIIAMMAALFVPAFADSHAANVEAGETLFEENFDGDSLDAQKWKCFNTGYKLEGGKVHLGHGSHWVNDCPTIYTSDNFSNCIVTFKFSGDGRDCYQGFGIRGNGESGLYGGGRFGVPGDDNSNGLAFDLFIGPNATIDNKGAAVGISFCSGPNSANPQFTVAYPEGYDGKAEAEIKVVDAGEKITVYINSKELVTIELAGLEDGAYTSAKAYDAAGNEVFNGAATVLEEGTISFYQRNNYIIVDDLVISGIKEASDTPSAAAELRGYSFDAFVTNYVDITTGEYKIVDLGPVDGSDGSISNIGYYGWIGFNEAIDSFGYQINDDAPVFDGAFAFTTEDAIKEDANGGQFGQRFLIVVPTSELKGANTIKAVVKLAGGAVVSLDGKALAEGARALPNTVVEYTGPAAPDTQPETVPQTGDATVAMFAVIAVLAMGAAVVFMKKRAF